MPFPRFFRSFGRSHVADSPTAPVEPATASGVRDDVTAYPPVDPGIPCRSVDEILAAHQDLIRRIKLSYGSDQPTFERDLLGLIRSYAGYVHLLPATPDNYFSSPAGLLRMGLEIAFYALQATDGQIFSGRMTISQRHNLEPRWRYATFVAGLCSEIHRTLSHVIVTDHRGNEWPPYLQPLSEWLRAARLPRYFLRWIPNAAETRALGVFALPQIIASSTLHYLAEGNTVVVPHMMACISGMPVHREHNILDQLVRHAAALVIDRDLRSSAERYGKPQLGSHLERYLIDAMRRLVASNAAWTPNEAKSRVWYGNDGLYVVWPNSAADICKLLDADRLPGIPKSPETILEILVAAGVIEPRDESSATWSIYPANATAPIEAVRLTSPTILLAALETAPAPLAVELTRAPRTPSERSPDHHKRPAGAPQQLSLPVEPADPRDAQPQQARPTQSAAPPAANIPRPAAPPPAPAPTFALDAPMRLSPPLRAALAEIVATLNGSADHAAACTTPSGVFLPLKELERRHLDPSLAIRALADVAMLVPSPSGKTVVREFGGEDTLGLVIHPRFVTGLDAEDFPPAVSKGGPRHAGA